MPDNVSLGTTITGELPHEARRLACVREFQANWQLPSPSDKPRTVQHVSGVRQ